MSPGVPIYMGCPDFQGLQDLSRGTPKVRTFHDAQFFSFLVFMLFLKLHRLKLNTVKTLKREFITIFLFLFFLIVFQKEYFTNLPAQTVICLKLDFLRFCGHKFYFIIFFTKPCVNESFYNVILLQK